MMITTINNAVIIPFIAVSLDMPPVVAAATLLYRADSDAPKIAICLSAVDLFFVTNSATAAYVARPRVSIRSFDNVSLNSNSV